MSLALVMSILAMKNNAGCFTVQAFPQALTHFSFIGWLPASTGFCRKDAQNINFSNISIIMIN